MTPRSLKLAKDLSLPLDAVTQTFLVVGKRGSGKSNTAARLVEQFHHAGLPFVVLDPVDTWWGLKAARDGGKGLDVYVFGGRKQDLPLNAGDGALIAGVLCEHRVSMVLSVKHLSGRERSGFMVAFAQTLFQKWGGGPLHVVLEEAHELAPQMAAARGGGTDGEAAMLGAFKRLWKLGRASGIGGTAVTQRPASLSKDITTQSEILVAHRTIGPQDVKAIGEWVKYHGERLDILAELPTLPTGEAFVWAPEFPEGKAIGLKRTSVLLRETYDSASTPKVGEQRVEPKELAAVDLERLREKMASTIEKAKADDPRELRKLNAEKDKRIKELEAAASRFSTSNEGKKQEGKAALTDADRALLEKVGGGLKARADKAQEIIALEVDRLNSAVQKVIAEYLNTTRGVALDASRDIQQTVERVGFQKILDKLSAVSSQSAIHNTQAFRPASTTHQERQFVRAAQPAASPGGSRREARPAGGDGTLGNSGLRRMMVALAQRQGLSARQLGVRAGMSSSSGSFRTYLSQGRGNGWLDGTRDRLVITNDGIAALGSYDPLPEGQELQAHWLRELGESGAARMLRALADAHPRGLTKDELGAATEMSATSGSFRTYLSRLRTLELITGKETIFASEELF